MKQDDIGTRGWNMLLQSSHGEKTGAPMRGSKFGRIELVAKNPSFDPKPETGRKVTGMTAPDGHDGALPDPAWSQDIRDYYNAVVEEPVPQEFLDLLARIASDIDE